MPPVLLDHLCPARLPVCFKHSFLVREKGEARTEFFVVLSDRTRENGLNLCVREFDVG